MLKSSQIKRHRSSTPVSATSALSQERHLHRRRETSDTAGGCELRTSKLNVARGGAIYEKARSRRERNRSALMRQSSASRDQAVPLQRGGARGPGSAVFHKSDGDGIEEQMAEKGRLRMLRIADSMRKQGLHPKNQLLPSERRPQATKVGKTQRCLKKAWKPKLSAPVKAGAVKVALAAKLAKAGTSNPRRSSSGGFSSATGKKHRISSTSPDQRRPSHRGDFNESDTRPPAGAAKLDRTSSKAFATRRSEKPPTPATSETTHNHPSYERDLHRAAINLAITPTSPAAQIPAQSSSNARSNAHLPAVPNLIDLTFSEPVVIDLSLD